jgi:hypothetical protein
MSAATDSQVNGTLWRNDEDHDNGGYELPWNVARAALKSLEEK